MTRAHDLIAGIAGNVADHHLPNAKSWMQGRTLYGGASALLAYTAATRELRDLPPLRAAQIGFVAPVGETVSLQAQMVRQGRNVSQGRAEIACDGATALGASFLFGAERPANAAYPASRLADWPGSPKEAEPTPLAMAPVFLRENFEMREGMLSAEPTTPPVARRWIRLRTPSGLDPLAELILIGDTLPPSAMLAMQRAGPLSSINWAFNILDPQPQTEDGWWLAETAGEWAAMGYSSERLRVWNTSGTLMMTGLQSVAIFG